MSADSFDVWLTRVETKLDFAIGQGSDHEGRIRLLERKIWMAAGAASAVTALATYVINR